MSFCIVNLIDRCSSTTAGRLGNMVIYVRCHRTRPSPTASLIGVENQLQLLVLVKIISVLRLHCSLTQRIYVVKGQITEPLAFSRANDAFSMNRPSVENTSRETK